MALGLMFGLGRLTQSQHHRSNGVGRPGPEYCRPPQAVDGGGQVNQSKVDYGEDEDDKPLLETILKTGAQFYMNKEIAGEFGKGIGKGLDSDEGDD